MEHSSTWRVVCLHVWYKKIMQIFAPVLPDGRFPLHETKLLPPENEFIGSLNLPAEKASGKGVKISSVKWKPYAQSNIDKVMGIDLFFSDLVIWSY